MAFSRVFYGPSSNWQGQNFKDLYDQLYILTEGKSKGVPMGEISDEVSSVNKQPYMPHQYPLDLVLLGALNPAIAQMVGLYWIDQPGTRFQRLMQRRFSRISVRQDVGPTGREMKEELPSRQRFSGYTANYLKLLIFLYSIPRRYLLPEQITTADLFILFVGFLYKG